MQADKALYLPGLKPVLEALEQKPRQILEIYIRENLSSKESAEIRKICEERKIPVKLVDAKTLDQLLGSKNQVNCQGAAAKIKPPSAVSLDELLTAAPDAPLPLVLALDQIQDPGNLGALSRTAYALGCAGLLLPVHNGALISPGAMRSSAGALASLPRCEVANLARSLDEAAERDFAIYAAARSPASQNAYRVDWHFPAILVLGNEGKGIRPGVLKRCANSVVIPFRRDFDSLNIAQAAAILISLISMARG